MNNLLKVIICSASSGFIGGCGAVDTFIGKPTDQYLVEPENSYRATPKPRDPRWFVLDGGTITIMSHAKWDYPQYGVSLTEDFDTIDPTVDWGSTFYFLIAIKPDRDSTVTVELDEYLITTDSQQAPVKPTHFTLKGGFREVQCTVTRPDTTIRAHGNGCYVTLFYAGIDYPRDGYTLNPAPVLVNDSIYAFPVIIYDAN